MSLRQALNTFVRTAPFAISLPKTPAAIEANARLAKMFGENGKQYLPAEDLDDFSVRIAALLGCGDPLDRRDLLRAPWCIWASTNPLSRKPRLVERLVAQIREAGRRNIYRMLAAAWLHNFKSDGACVPLVGSFLKEHLLDLGAALADAHTVFQIFDAAAGPNLIVDAAFQGGCAPDELLSRIGFRGGLALGYREHVHRLGFERFEHGANSDPLDRLKLVRRWTCAGGTVRFESLKTAAVRAALEPFGDEMPGAMVRDAFLDFALQLLQDPRLYPGAWTDCPASEKIAWPWLTEQSLRQFFGVLEELDRNQQWAYRRVFWAALYRRGYIDGAWAIFECAGAQTVQRMFGQKAGFGCFEGFQPGHSVLLLSIRGLIVAEWSHNNPCSIWDKADCGPRLYQSRYSPSELRKPHRGDDTATNMASQGIFWHSGAGRYRWQGRIAAYLRQRRGLDLDPADYKADAL